MPSTSFGLLVKTSVRVVPGRVNSFRHRVAAAEFRRTLSRAEHAAYSSGVNPIICLTGVEVRRAHTHVPGQIFQARHGFRLFDVLRPQCFRHMLIK